VILVFEAELWNWDARRVDTWTFVSLPVEASDQIRDLADGPRRGFGSLPVRVTIGASTWTTSIFPGGTDGRYVLPVKRSIRQAEHLDTGDTTKVTMELIAASR
jgi:uncharacterized protein DUF1905